MKRRLTRTSFFAYTLLLGGFALASLAPGTLTDFIFVGSGVFAGAGVLCCLATALLSRKKLINPSIQCNQFKQIARLFLGQIVLIGMTFVFFHFLETQTQINTRLHLLETGYIVQLLQKNPLSLGVLPFIIYSVLGIGLAYFSICLGRKPVLARAIPLKNAGEEKTPQAIFFVQNLMSIVVDIVTLIPFVLVSSFTLGLVCEFLNDIFGLGSLFSVPLRTVFICALLIIFFQSINKRLVKWMTEQQISVGKILMVYILSFSVCLVWLQGSSDWLTFGLELPAGNGEKSYFAGLFSQNALETRIQYLIWGWWMVWTPMMASWVSRCSIGFSVPRALLQSLILPVFIFIWALQQIDIVVWEGIYEYLKWPGVQAFILLGLFSGIWFVWGEMRTRGDILRGAMLSMGQQLSRLPLTRWMTILLLWLTCYIPGWFMLGWLPMQWLLTLCGFFMLLVVGLFVGAWGLVLHRMLKTESASNSGSFLAGGNTSG